MDLLDWQNSCTQIKDRGHHLLQTEKWSDCKFLVGSGQNQRIIAGHKMILAMASPVFERMFYGLFPDKSDPIIIPDVQPDAFQSLLEYIYADIINITSFDKACELCYVAKKYMLPHVVEQCTQFLWADLSPKNACRAYEFARLFDEPRLMQSSMNIIGENTRKVLEDPSFLDIEFRTLMAILDQDKLNIESELDLFNGLVKYAIERGIFTEEYGILSADRSKRSSEVERPSDENTDPPLDVENIDVGLVEEIKMEPDVSAMMQSQEDDVDIEQDLQEKNQHQQQQQVRHISEDEIVILDSDASGAETDGNDDDDANSESRLNVDDTVNNLLNVQRHMIDEDMLRQAVRKIRFLTLTPQQFAEGPARSKLLQQHEALAILIKISSPTTNDLPMPEGFCISRRSRNFYEPRQQRDQSFYWHSTQPSTSSNALQAVVPIHIRDPIPDITGPEYYGPNGGSDPDPDVSTNDTRRCYCVRTLNQQFDYRNASVTDCGLTFQVDSNIWITGVQVPTQVLCGELMNSAGFSERYTEILYAHIQDMQGSRLTYTHCTSRVRYDSLLEISFDRPVYIYRNQTYKVFVVFNKIGWYPMYSSCLPDVVCNRVKFMFNVGNPSESVRDGLIRAIVFLTPQPEQSINMNELL